MRSNSFLEVNKALDRVQEAEADLVKTLRRCLTKGTTVIWRRGARTYLGEVLDIDSGGRIQVKGTGRALWISANQLIIRKPAT